MNPKSLVGSVALLLLGTSMMATSYHIADTVGPAATNNPATQWIGSPTSQVVVNCESEGLNDKINPLAVKTRGVGGLCYASSFHDTVKKDNVTVKKNKPAFSQKDLFNLNVTQWSRVAPTCVALAANENLGVDNTPGGAQQPAVGTLQCPGDTPGPLLGTYFIRCGNNAHSVTGTWGGSFYYPEALCWWIGAGGGGNPNGLPASGHVTFFVDDPLTAGSYCFQQAVASLPAVALRTPSTSGQVFFAPVACP